MYFLYYFFLNWKQYSFLLFWKMSLCILTEAFSMCFVSRVKHVGERETRALCFWACNSNSEIEMWVEMSK